MSRQRGRTVRAVSHWFMVVPSRLGTESGDDHRSPGSEWHERATDGGRRVNEQERKRAPKPRPLTQPSPKGLVEQHMADAPHRERGPRIASTNGEPCGSSLAILREAVT